MFHPLCSEINNSKSNGFPSKYLTAYVVSYQRGKNRLLRDHPPQILFYLTIQEMIGLVILYWGPVSLHCPCPQPYEYANAIKCIVNVSLKCWRCVAFQWSFNICLLMTECVWLKHLEIRHSVKALADISNCSGFSGVYFNYSKLRPDSAVVGDRVPYRISLWEATTFELVVTTALDALNNELTTAFHSKTAIKPALLWHSVAMDTVLHVRCWLYLNKL